MRLVFAGTPQFAAVALEALLRTAHHVAAVYTQPDRPSGRGRRVQASPVKRLALEHDIPLHQPLNLKEPGEHETLRALAPDVVVVVAYGLILPKAVLVTPRYGCVNVHASLLPRWRGAAPIQRALLAGDAQTGITIMQMERGLDTGPILSQVPCPILAQDTAGSLHDRLAELGAQALVETLDGLVHGSVQPIAQNDRQATYAAKLDKNEAWIDWSRPAVELGRAVRAFNPWPVAQTLLDDEIVRIWSAIVEQDAGGPPGTLLAARRDGLRVATGAGVLSIRELQLAGGRPVTSAEFLNAHARWATPGRVFRAPGEGQPGTRT